MKTDPAIARVRAVRHRISESVGHDPGKLVDRYIALQRRHAGRLLHAAPVSGEKEKATSRSVRKQNK